MSTITLQFDTAADLESALLDALQNNEGHVSGIAAYLAQDWAEAVAPEAKPDDKPMLIMTGAQLRAALDFVNPDAGDADQLETEVCIQWGAERTDEDGGTEPAGLRAWLADYPDEGSISLDLWGTEEPPAPPAPLPGKESLTLSPPGNYIQTVPDHCDRIIWRGRYWALPIKSIDTPVSPTLEAAPARTRDLSDDDMDKVLGYIAALNSGDIGFHAFCDRIAALSAQASPEYRTGFDEAPSTFNQEDAAPADYPPQSEIEAIAERLGATDPDDSLWRDFAHAAIDADRAQRSGVSADPLPRPLLTDLEIQGLRRQARNDPRCADQHWFILMVRAIESYYGVTGAAAQSQPLVEPQAVTIFNALDEAAQTILGEETRNNVREWLRRAWHHNVCPAIAASPQHQVKKGEPS